MVDLKFRIRFALLSPCDSIHAKTANTKAKHRDDKEPEEPWPDPYADHRGPIQDGRHIRDTIDNLTRHPEVAIVKDGVFRRNEESEAGIQTRQERVEAKLWTLKEQAKDNQSKARPGDCTARHADPSEGLNERRRGARRSTPGRTPRRSEGHPQTHHRPGHTRCGGRRRAGTRCTRGPRRP